MTLVLDASAAVEYLLKTAQGAQVALLVEKANLIAPELLDVEVLAVLRKEALAHRLSARRAEEAIEDLRDWPIHRLPHRPLLERAWSLRANTSAYDALYVAAAIEHGAALVTADGPLSRAPLRGVVVHNIGAPLL
ncbi:MAG: type II toxin-antitoxin system VapC family toxin [Myxococcota bacterium]